MDNTDDPTDAELERIEKILKQVPKDVPRIRRKSKSKTAKQHTLLCKAISSRLSEYCDCYMLFGFDTNGNPIILINSANDLEIRGLTDLVHEFVDTHMSSGRDNEEDYEDDDDF